MGMGKFDDLSGPLSPESAGLTDIVREVYKTFIYVKY